MDNLDAYLKLMEIEMRLYNAVNDVVISAVTEKYKNPSINTNSYYLPVIDSKATKYAPKSSSLTREERLKYMRACQKNWGKQVPRGGNRK